MAKKTEEAEDRAGLETVRVSCIYGDANPGDIVEVDTQEAARLVDDLKVAVRVDQAAAETVAIQE